MIEKIRLYAQAFNLQSLYSVLQFLQHFDWNQDALMAMTEYMEIVEDERRQIAESRKAKFNAFQDTQRKEAGMSKEDQEAGRPMMTIGFCPRCNERMVGEPVRKCGDKKRGRQRLFYKECTSCPYYAEIWKNKNKYDETEGG
jgi:hypothetical protein